MTYKTVDQTRRELLEQIQYFRNNIQFTDNPSPYTPERLIRRILTKLLKKKTTSILVAYTLEFAVELFLQGKTNVTITTKHFCLGTKYIAENLLGYKYYTIEEVKGMSKKFSCILMNQPYDQPIPGAKQTKSVWHEYIYPMLELLEDNTGILVDICPYSWTKSNDGKLKKVRNAILNRNLTHLETGVEVEFPTTPGVQIGWFVVENNTYSGQTTYIDNYKPAQTIDFRNGLPVDADEQFRLDLVQKIINSSTKKFDFILNDKGKNIDGNGQLKVVANYSKAYYTDKRACNNMPITTDPINHLQAYIAVNDTVEGEKHKSFLHSKAIIWLTNNYKRHGQTGFCDAVKRGVIPQFETKIWTDIMIYKSCNLTKEEIDYIERNS
tara:strand:+ start:2015 stop:3157 length:1143 start_codon:yes stop_codon:yes gene_type:complete